MVRFQPFSMAIQTRFKWRHKETDRWRRLMDASCFQVDWMTQTLGPNLSQNSGNWSHILTCAHVVCPWNYPNFYPPTGPTRFVSHITLADTMTQIRLPAMQGQAVHKHFTSNHSVFVHMNPRLDLCVVHPEQHLKRSGETKMLWLQNEGLSLRPRLEINEPLEVGDYVWIYGVTAHESLFDEEKAPEPLMVPTGIRARVHTKTREHFFLDTLNVEGAERGKVSMGMCGSVVMRNGKCVGMLTATVHEESTCKELAGTAMCTYASDIFEFLLEVESQMKNPMPNIRKDESMFEQRRRAEGNPVGENKDWALDHTRLARHIEVPVSLWHMDEKWMTEEDMITSMVFGKSGTFNQDVQESALGYDMNSSKSGGDRPSDIPVFSTAHKQGKPHNQGERRDDSPTGIYAPPEDFKSGDPWDSHTMDDVRGIFNDSVSDPREAALIDAMRRSLENAKVVKEREKMKETAFKHASRGNDGDPLNMGDAGHYGGNADAGVENFSEETLKQETLHRRQMIHEDDEPIAATTTVRGPEATASGPMRGGGFDQPWRRAPEPSKSDVPKPRSKSKKADDAAEKERKYQEALLKRHAGGAARDFDTDSIWGKH